MAHPTSEQTPLYMNTAHVFELLQHFHCDSRRDIAKRLICLSNHLPLDPLVASQESADAHHLL